MMGCKSKRAVVISLVLLILSMSSSGSLINGRLRFSRWLSSFIVSVVFPSTMVKDVNRNCYIQNWVGGKTTYRSRSPLLVLKVSIQL